MECVRSFNALIRSGPIVLHQGQRRRLLVRQVVILLGDYVNSAAANNRALSICTAEADTETLFSVYSVSYNEPVIERKQIR